MDRSTEKLIKTVSKLSRRDQDHDIIRLLTDDLLASHRHVKLYVEKARALNNVGNYVHATVTIAKALTFFPDDVEACLMSAHLEHVQGRNSNAREVYYKILDIDAANVSAYVGLATTFTGDDEYLTALDFYQKALDSNSRYYYIYYSRAFLYANRKEYNKALSDLGKAIQLQPNFSGAYLFRADIWGAKGEYNKAIKEYKKALENDENQKHAYYNRALIHNALGKDELALNDFTRFVTLEINTDDYLRKNALAEIDRLNKKLANKWYDEIDKLLLQIKRTLLFEQECLTHYTSMSAAKEMILNSSLFRISEGAFLNDTSEGRELFNYLSFSMAKTNNEETISEIFVERPFIGSFVADTKYNDLALWRMYGKEGESEAKGCALTIYRKAFLNSIEEHFSKAIPNTKEVNAEDSGIKASLQESGKYSELLKPFLESLTAPTSSGANDINRPAIFELTEKGFSRINVAQLTKVGKNCTTETNEKFTFYNVAYRNKDEFLIPGSEESKEKTLNELLSNLQVRIAALREDQKLAIAELLNDIAYLFKSAEYQYEHEVRLVVQDVGMAKKIEKSSTPPRVYMELANIQPVLHKITLGPKVERADEWAAAFNYYIKDKFGG